MNRNTLQRVCAILLITVMLITFFPVLVKAPSLPRLYLEDPLSGTPVATASPGENFTIDLKIENVYDLYMAAINIRWDGSVLDVTDIAEGEFLKRGGNTLFVPAWFNEPDEIGIKDYLMIGNVLEGAFVGVAGNGTLATITFLVEADGESALNLAVTELRDTPGRLIEHAVEDGYFKVTPPTFSVDPTSVVDPTLVAGEEFTVNITISDVVDVLEIDFKMGYDRTLLNATEVTIIEFLKEQEVLRQEIDRGEGYIWVNVNSTTAESVSGNGTLASVTFEVLGIGSCVLDLYETELRDKLSEPLPDISGLLPPKPPSHLVLDKHTAPAADSYFSNVLAGHDIAVKRILVYPTRVTIGDSVSINVTIVNAGGFNETFDVSVRYDGSPIETQRDIALESKMKTTVGFRWNTTDVPPQVCSITANASEVLDEVNTDNNQLTFPGDVTIEGTGGSDITLYVVAAGAGVVIVAAAVLYFVKVRKPT